MKRLFFPIFVINMALISAFLMWFLASVQSSIQASIQASFPKSYTATILPVTLTAYSPSKAQTDSTPFLTASGRTVTIQDLQFQLFAAASRDLLSKFTPGAPLKYGDKIYLEITIIDTMHERWTNRIDLFVRNKQIAKYIGLQPNRNIIILKE